MAVFSIGGSAGVTNPGASIVMFEAPATRGDGTGVDATEATGAVFEAATTSAFVGDVAAEFDDAVRSILFLASRFG